MAVMLTPRERVERTLEFKDVDVVATGEIIQNGDLINLFSNRRVQNDWTLKELAETYRSLQIDVGMLLAPTVPCHIESPIGLDVIYNMAGWELFSYLIAEYPGIISEVFEELNLHEVNRVHLVADKKISPLVVVYCDIASKHDVIFSPEYLRAEFFPRLKRLVHAWNEHDINGFV
jgi:hypothetical protein